MRTTTLICVLSMALPAAAADLPPRAEALLQEARQALAAGDFVLARDSARKGLGVVEDFRLQCNLATALHRLGELQEAFDSYGQCRALVEGLPKENPARTGALGYANSERGKVESELELTHQHFEVRSEPSRSFFYVDDKARGLLETPATVWLPFGPHRIVFQSSGFEIEERAVRAGKGPARTVAVKLVKTAPTGTLTLSSKPAGAVVILAGEAYGLTPRKKMRFEVGRYKVRLEKLGHEPWERAVDVIAGKHQNVDAVLREAVPVVKASPWPWVATGIGVALIGGAVVPHLQAIDVSNQINDLDNTRPDYDQRFDTLSADRDDKVTSMIALYAAGGAIALGAAIWGIVDLLSASGPEDQGPSTGLRVGPLLGPGLSGATLDLTF